MLTSKSGFLSGLESWAIEHLLWWNWSCEKTWSVSLAMQNPFLGKLELWENLSRRNLPLGLGLRFLHSVNNLPMTTSCKLLCNIHLPLSCIFLLKLTMWRELIWKDKESRSRVRTWYRMAVRGVALVAGAGPGIGNFNVVFWKKLRLKSASNNNKSQDNFLSVFDCLSVWWGKRDQSTWAVFTEPMSYIVLKSIVSNLRFVRTRPQHWSQGQRCTGRIGEQRESQKGQSDAQFLIVETNELRRVSSKNTLVTIPLPGAAVARRFAREGFTVAVARYSLPHLVTITTAI